jgi:hypothetical protein
MISSHQSLEEMRIEFDRTGGRTLSFPIAGTLAWTVTAIFGAILPDSKASIALFICNGLIFPVSLLIAYFLKEDLLKAKSPLDKLFGRSVLMINLSWAITIPFWMVMPASLPLSVGVVSGLHWIVYGWIVNHPIGMLHAVVRTVLVTACWFAFPGQRFTVIPIIIVLMYVITIYVLATRTLATKSVTTARLDGA